MAFRRNLDTQFHREFGIHSGIPSCCVDWFVENILPFWKESPGLEKMPQMIRGWMDRLNAIGFYYFPCPECYLLGKPARVHRCGRRCGIAKQGWKWIDR